MPKITWGAEGERLFESGLDRGVLYVDGKPGVPWNGLVSVSEKAAGGAAASAFQDGVKYLNNDTNDEFEATIKAFMYPDEFEECDGTVSFGKGLSIGNQPRKQFGMSYRTRVGNDTKGEELGYKIHLVYNALVLPTSRDHNTRGEKVDPENFSWSMTTRPVVLDGRQATAHFTIDSRKTDPYLMAAFEELIYGTGASQPWMPTAQQVFTLFRDWETVRVVDHGDGTWTASGPDPVIKFLDESTFEISWHSANPIDAVSYTLSSQ